VRSLLREGISAFFGIPGGAISPVSDALLDAPQAEVMVMRHEAEAVFAASGHFLAAQAPAAVFVTSGPGVTNALTGLCSAHCDGIPLVLLVGEVPRALQGKGALQDGSAHHLHITNVARSLSKACWEAVDTHGLAMLVHRAVRLATSGRPGPVVITLPLDVQTAGTFDAEVGQVLEAKAAFPASTMDRVRVALATSGRSVVLAGAGARRGDGPSALLDFAERHQVPVITTPKGKGVFPETHPQSLGVFGIGGHPSARAYLERGVDTLVALGTSLGDLATEGWSELLAPSRCFVHVDVDGAVIGRHYAADVAVAGPLAPFLRELGGPAGPRAQREVSGVSWFTDPETTTDGAEGRISPARAIWELQRVLPADTIFVVDSGEHFLFAAHYLRIARPDAFIAMTGLGAMGSSIGAAIGAQLARPSRSVAVIMGDGGFGMVATQISDAVAAGLPLTVCVINDGRLAMSELGHLNVYGRSPSFATPDIDVVMLARAMGAAGLVVARTGDILAQAAAFGRRGAPLVVDVRVDRSFKLPKKDRIDALGKQRGVSRREP
jgi:acetolactate synthase-1/2/3 large subunit